MIGALMIVVILLAANGCVGEGRRIRLGELQTESQSVELGGVESVRVELDMGAGELDVAGGADGLLDAGFTYNVAGYKPEVSYGSGVLAKIRDMNLPLVSVTQVEPNSKDES